MEAGKKKESTVDRALGEAFGSFSEMDTNHDGIISRDEWRARGGDAAGFDVIDTDHDGKISAAEWTVAEKAHKVAGKAHKVVEKAHKVRLCTCMHACMHIRARADLHSDESAHVCMHVRSRADLDAD